MGGEVNPHLEAATVDELEPSHPEFYPSVALRALTRILRDASLSMQHAKVSAGVAARPSAPF